MDVHALTIVTFNRVETQQGLWHRWMSTLSPLSLSTVSKHNKANDIKPEGKSKDKRAQLKRVVEVAEGKVHHLTVHEVVPGTLNTVVDTLKREEATKIGEARTTKEHGEPKPNYKHGRDLPVSNVAECSGASALEQLPLAVAYQVGIMVKETVALFLGFERVQRMVSGALSF
jgi:hypothetical protein